MKFTKIFVPLIILCCLGSGFADVFLSFTSILGNHKRHEFDETGVIVYKSVENKRKETRKYHYNTPNPIAGSKKIYGVSLFQTDLGNFKVSFQYKSEEKLRVGKKKTKLFKANISKWFMAKLEYKFDIIANELQSTHGNKNVFWLDSKLDVEMFNLYKNSPSWNSGNDKIIKLKHSFYMKHDSLYFVITGNDNNILKLYKHCYIVGNYIYCNLTRDDVERVDIQKVKRNVNTTSFDIMFELNLSEGLAFGNQVTLTNEDFDHFF
jgi:hypothetical protein